MLWVKDRRKGVGRKSCLTTCSEKCCVLIPNSQTWGWKKSAVLKNLSHTFSAHWASCWVKWACLSQGKLENDSTILQGLHLKHTNALKPMTMSVVTSLKGLPCVCSNIWYCQLVISWDIERDSFLYNCVIVQFCRLLMSRHSWCCLCKRRGVR